MSKILLVDDDVDLLAHLKEALEMEGFATASATSSRQAWEMMVEDPPDLLVLDISLPDLSGFELCRLMQEHPKLNSVPVVMLTVRNSPSDLANGFRSGADDYITKPFDAEELVLRVRSQLHHLYHEEVSELTGLPGSKAVERVLSKLHSQTQSNAVIVYVDISNLRAYNVAYGWSKGNQVILLTADLLRRWARRSGSFVGHLGGDNFVAVVDRTELNRFTALLGQQFQEEMVRMYSPIDVSRGHLLVINQRGMLQYVPLLQLQFDVVEP